MAIKFQYNKTSLQALEKQLKIRQKTLPTIKNKESALRVEVKKAKEEAQRIESEIQERIMEYQSMMNLWSEFKSTLLEVKGVELGIQKIAGVKIPVLQTVNFKIKEFSIFNNPKWYYEGITLLKALAKLQIEKRICHQKVKLLEHARKKTTQKVNLFEKVQIPGFEDAIRKIKRFMEDEENLSKSSQKIIKARQARKEAS